MTLPRTARDLAVFGRGEALLYDGLIAFCAATGWWREPAAYSGDLEEMGVLDKVYWYYKAQRPVCVPQRGFGLEALGAGPRTFKSTAPLTGTSLTLSAAGDLMNHAWLGASRDTLYREVDDLLFGADVSMANLECVVAAEARPLEIDHHRGPKLTLDRAAFDGVAGRFSFLSVANNHSLDLGASGVESTIRALQERGVAFHGVNAAPSDAERASIIEMHGVRLGIIAWTFGLNAQKPPPGHPRIVNRARLNGRAAELDTATIEAQLSYCRAAGVDFIIAQLHWGMEFEYFPRPEQVAIAHRLAELGVDAIFGHHPHVVQPVEYYRPARDVSRTVPIFYSLGNLVNPFTASYMCRSAVARVELVKGEKTFVRCAELVEVDQTLEHERIVLRRCVQL